MKSKIELLSNQELRVYAEIANESINGICDTPATVISHKCGLSIYFYEKILAELERKGVITQIINCGGVPRTLRLGKNTSKI